MGDLVGLRKGTRVRARSRCSKQYIYGTFVLMVVIRCLGCPCFRPVSDVKIHASNDSAQT